MSFFLAFVLGALAVLALAILRGRMLAFPAQKAGDYAAKTPEFDIRRHINGPILCEGVIYGPTGRVASRFVADFEARWEGNAGTMTEEFRYDSGATQSRRWAFTLGNDGHIRAQAPDVVGYGEGWQRGSAVHLRYRIRLPEDAGGHVLDVIDWMYLMENGTIMNRSQFRKFGIPVGELVATMRPKGAA
ncbi:DUF3833 domain-containing protein [Rhodovulum strictum]|uniref:DUF3833 family protein n=1 Tax=Rhodovulum strictum TaxID=58314 RepID=A0A844BKY7_9RHOB|nr:DUF3833 domain-containing protein [Rhodovulum strictum]MRH21613.1 DUF3833 family protein [Rhodovulum strictum]